MTVAELIAELQRYPPDLPVVADAGDNECHPWNRTDPELVLETLFVVHKGDDRVWEGPYEIQDNYDRKEREKRGLALPPCAFVALHLAPGETPPEELDCGDITCEHKLPPQPYERDPNQPPLAVLRREQEIRDMMYPYSWERSR